MSIDPYEPYGPVVETSMRIVTWNVWGRFGRWRERQAGIEETLVAAAPDVVCLVESWSGPQANPPGLVAGRLGYQHSVSVGGVGHPVLCQRLGALPAGQPQLSDHYGVLADLRC